MVNTTTLARPCVLECEPYIAGRPPDEVKRLLGIRNVVKLASNENPLGPSPLALKAARKALLQANLYPDDACSQLKSALAEKWGIGKEQILVGNGSMQILELICKTFIREEEEVVAGFPSFRLFGSLVRAAGGRLVSVPLKEHVHDLDAMERRIGERTKLVLLCNPNNPTGTVVSADALMAFLRRISRNVIVVLDEAYADYVEGGAWNPLSYLEAFPGLIVLRTFSKIYGLAGMRVGYCIATEETVYLLERARMPFVANSIGLAAACAALEDEEFRQRTLQVNHEGKLMLYRRLPELGLDFIPTDANFLAVKVGGNDLRFFEEMLREGIIVFAGSNTSMPGYIRLTIGTGKQIRRFLLASERVLKRIGRIS